MHKCKCKCLVLCDFHVGNYLPKIVLPSSKFDKVLFCLFYHWPRHKITKIVKDILILTVAGRAVNQVKIISFRLNINSIKSILNL